MHRFGILGNAVLHSHPGKDVCLRAGIDDHVCDKADSDSRPTERDSLGHSEFENSTELFTVTQLSSSEQYT